MINKFKRGNKMKKYDYLIVGAGVFGCTIANLLKSNNKSVLIIDKTDHIGGDAYTKEIEGINVHMYGAHIFRTNDKKVWDFVNSFVEFNRFTNSPLANYRGEIYNLPFNMNTFYQMWKTRTPEEAKAKIEEQKAEYNITEPKNLEEKAISLVGIDIYKKLIKEYTEKQWGKSCTELPESIIRRLPLRFTYDNNYYNDKYQGIPIGGYTNFFQKMIDGIDIELNSNYFDNKEKYDTISDKIIFTGRIDKYFDCQFGELEYRSLKFEHEILDIENYQGNAVVNYTDSDTPYTRVIEHKHFEFKTGGKTVVTKEYPIAYQPGMMEHYTVNDEKNNSLYQKYKDLADQQNKVIFCGRLGEYKYYDMQDTIKRAFDLNEELKNKN